LSFLLHRCCCCCHSPRYILYRLWYHSIRAILHSTTHTYRHAFRLDGIYTQHSSTGAFSPSCKRGFAASGSLYYSLPWWEPMAKREVYIRKTLSGSASPRSPIYPTFIPI
jgi:hypothetical protein